MSVDELVRAWKDQDYQGNVPHPSGDIVVELPDEGDDTFLTTKRQCTWTCWTMCTVAPDCYLP